MGEYLSKASSQGKAVLLVYELQKGMSPQDLRGLFLELAVTDDERRALVQAMDDVLRQHRYPPAEIWQLLDKIYPERATTADAAPSTSAPTVAKASAPPGKAPVDRAEPLAQKPVGKRTQPVKSPFLKPFEGGFDAPKQGKPAEIAHPAEEPAVQSAQPAQRPTRKQEVPAATTRSLRDVDKTGMFGATLKGLDINAVRPKTKARVLVADDDQRIRLIYRTKLEENGYTVIEAENGMEAWRFVSTGEADVAVLDMKMPGYHGLDVLSRMSDAGMDIPVIISTAYDQLSDEFVVATYPRLKYLVKPVDPNDLVATVNEFVAQ